MLLDLLSVNAALMAKGYGVRLDQYGSVVVHRGGHVRGGWRSVLGVLEWTPAGYYVALFKVADVDAAVWHTLVALGLNGDKD